MAKLTFPFKKTEYELILIQRTLKYLSHIKKNNTLFLFLIQIGIIIDINVLVLDVNIF